MMAHHFMRCGLLIVVLLLGPACFAAEPTPGSLLRRTSWVRFEIAGGRITSSTLSRSPTRTFGAEAESAKEGLSINPSSDEPSLSYRYETADRQWTFELRGIDDVVLSDTSTAGESVTLKQSASAPLKLTIQRTGSPKQEIVGRTLWHLLLFQPEARAHLLPRLEALNSDWRLSKQIAEIKEQLLAANESTWREDGAQWRRCVEKLGNPDYQVRQAADRQLRKGGAAAAALLQSLDRNRMSAEQARRVTEILQSVAPQIDEPAAVAASWVYDADAWCQLLRDDDVRYRTAAATHLAELLGRPLAYDPLADTATRTSQIRAIEDALVRR